MQIKIQSKFKLLSILFLSLISYLPFIHGMVGRLDTTYNPTGVTQPPSLITTPPGTVITDFGGNDDAEGSAIQTDNKVVVSGSTDASGTNQFALARYNTDASLDTSFNGTGLVTTTILGTDDESFAVAIQSDNKIVAAGFALDSSGTSTNHFALVRYNTDGSLDTLTFNPGAIGSPAGTVVLPNFDTSSFDTAYALIIQDDGKILVGGFTVTGAATSFALARLNLDGSLDTTFNGTGQVVTTFGSATVSQINSLALQVDNKIVAGGYTNASGTSNDFALARYNTDGSLDTTFNGTGLVITNINSGTNNQISSVGITNGKIVAGGLSNSSVNFDFTLARYNADGSLDTTFNTTGIVTTSLGGTQDVIKSIKVLSTDKIIAGGFSDASGGTDFALARYNANGSLDTTFNPTGDSDPSGTTTPPGTVTTSFRLGSTSRARSLVIQSDTSIVMAGISNARDLATNDFAVARYIACPVILLTPLTLAVGTTGQFYSQQIIATGGTPPYIFTNTGSLPPGLNLNSLTGVISGIPTAEGDYIFEITATDVNTCFVTQNYTITISCDAIAISPVTLNNAIINQSYSQQLLATGGSLPYNFTITNGSLPDGLSLSLSGLINGTPTEIGDFDFIINVSDANSCTQVQEYSLIVNASPTPNPIISICSLASTSLAVILPLPNKNSFNTRLPRFPVIAFPGSFVTVYAMNNDGRVINLGTVQVPLNGNLLDNNLVSFIFTSSRSLVNGKYTVFALARICDLVARSFDKEFIIGNGGSSSN